MAEYVIQHSQSIAMIEEYCRENEVLWNIEGDGCITIQYEDGSNNFTRYDSFRNAIKDRWILDMNEAAVIASEHPFEHLFREQREIAMTVIKYCQNNGFFWNFMGVYDDPMRLYIAGKTFDSIEGAALFCINDENDKNRKDGMSIT